GAKNTRLGNGPTASVSPTGTVSFTRPPTGFGSTPVVPRPLFGSMNARLSFELEVTTSFGPGADPSGMSATSVSVPQNSVGPFSPFVPVTAVPPIVARSTPVWKQGPIMRDGPVNSRNCWSVLVTALPLSRSNQPVQPASPNGFPPFPVKIVWFCGAPVPEYATSISSRSSPTGC